MTTDEQAASAYRLLDAYRATQGAPTPEERRKAEEEIKDLLPDVWALIHELRKREGPDDLQDAGLDQEQT